MAKISLLVFLFFSSTYSCESQPVNGNAHNTQKDSGNVNHKPAGVVTIRFIDSSNHRKDVISLFTYPDSLGMGTPVTINDSLIRIPINAPTFLTHADAQQRPYLLYPDETVNAVLNKNGEYKFSISDNPGRNEELLFFAALTFRYGKISGGPGIFEVDKRKYNDWDSLIVYEKQINSLKVKRLNFLDSVSAKGLLSPAFQEIARKIIEDGALHSVLFLYWKNKPLLTKKELYTEYIKSSAISFNKRKFLPAETSTYIGFLFVNLLTSDKLYGSISSTNDFFRRYDLITSIFSGVRRDFLLSNLIYSASKFGIKIPDSYFQSYKNDCKSPEYLSLTEQRIADLKVTQSVSAKGDVLLSIEKGNPLLFDSLIKVNKGKVIYIDFWASWCMPCRREMPDSRILQKEYAKQDILFLYLSVDDHYSDWRTAFKFENMSEAGSFLFLNTSSSAFLKKHKIDTAIPHYMIVGKDGTFINTDAPRPGDPELKKMLNDLLTANK